jgi:branched-chain amino acid transport system ATP-binding protein
MSSQPAPDPATPDPAAASAPGRDGPPPNLAAGERPLLDVQGVSKSFGGLKALTDVNLKIREGAIHAIIGPNGAGKSTLLNCLIGLLTPDEGQVTFDGRPLMGVKPHHIIQRGIARVFQTPQIFPALTLQENVAIAALARRDGQFAVTPRESLSPDHAIMRESADVLGRVGLGEQMLTAAQHLSRGDKRRLELAICLAANPKLLLLDEPTAGMSRHDTNRTIDLLKQISGSGMTLVVIEHDMHVVFSLAERITVLAQGQVIAEGTPDEVRGDPKVEEAYLGGATLE